MVDKFESAVFDGMVINIAGESDIHFAILLEFGKAFWSVLIPVLDGVGSVIIFLSAKGALSNAIEFDAAAVSSFDVIENLKMI